MSSPAPATRFQARLVLCVQCGAPLVLDAGARAARCAHCAAENVVGVRLDDPVGGAWGADEVARVEALRGQPRELVQEPLVAHLALEGRLLREREGEAFGLWQRLRADVFAQPALEAALVDLTLLLAARAGEQGDATRERGLVESALAASGAPRSRQLLAAALVDWSVRAGDLAAASAWLARCQPRASELVMDGAHRLARALLATATGDLRAVLQLLGGSPADLPVSARFVGAMDLLRANAWERLGRRATALDGLVFLELESSPFAAQQARLFARRHAALRLGGEAWAEARQQAQRTLAPTYSRAGMGLLIVLSLAAYFLLFPVLWVLLLSSDWLGGGLTFGLWIPGLLLASMGLRKLRATLRTRRVGFHGELAPARVVGASSEALEGWRGAVQANLVLAVVPDDAPPFQVEEAFRTTPERVLRTPVGAALHVRFIGREVSLQLPL